MSEATPTRTNPLAIASLVCGIIALPCTCGCYGFPFNILSIALGGVALMQISGDSTQGGKGMAYGGIATGILSFVLIVVLMVMGFGMGMLSAMMENM